MIEIDGSIGEGGGQILRTAIALAAVLGKEVRVRKIRAGRSEPGLKAQHLAGIEAAALVCGATLRGAEVGSAELVFRPSRLTGGRFRFDIGTAGSICLVLQTLMPLSAFLPESLELEITGGTDVKWSPPIDYVRMVTLPILGTMKYDGKVELVRRGYYPKGGGLVRFTSSPVASLSPIRSRALGIRGIVNGISHATGLPRHVAERQAESARQVLAARGFDVGEITINNSETSLSPGSGIVLWTETADGTVIGGDSLGERGKPAERVGEEAALRMVEEVEPKNFLDSHMGDMVIPFMALAKGESEVTVSRITQHCLTNVRIAEQVVGINFDVEGELGKPGLLRVEGLGHEAARASSSSSALFHSHP